MRSATGSWSRRGSNGRFVASKPLDVQPTTVGRDSAGKAHPNAGCPAGVETQTSGLPTIHPLLHDYRWQQQPSEALNFGRNFRYGLERTYNLRVRAEFHNVFNRLTLPALPTPPVQAAPMPASTQTFNSFGVRTRTLASGT